MNSDAIQGKIWKGCKKAATTIGKPFTLYRPSSNVNPISNDNIVAVNIMLAVSQDKNFMKPNKYGNAVWQALFDGNIAQVGDYFVGDDKIFFINAMDRTVPMTVVECNSTITKVMRVTQPTGKGAVGYGGQIMGTEDILLENWPVSQLQGNKWERNAVQLPGDERLPWWIFLFPYFSGVKVKTSDIIVDVENRRTVISNHELTSAGWRIHAGLSGA